MAPRLLWLLCVWVWSELPRAQGKCSYDCTGWPYKNCVHKYEGRSSRGHGGCMPPYFKKGSKCGIPIYPK